MCEQNYFDDEYDEELKVQQRQELVEMIWAYTLALEDYVVKLRSQVNELSRKLSLQARYPDVQSDFRVGFFQDLPAYKEFKTILDTEKTDLVLPD